MLPSEMGAIEALSTAESGALGQSIRDTGAYSATGAAQPLPAWLKTKTKKHLHIGRVGSLLKELSLHTVCESARCPNIGECWGRGTATFMILGDVCTRNCPYCALAHGRPLPPDPLEPLRLAAAAARLGLGHIVITSVNRDDLPDGGAGQFARCLETVRRRIPAATVEVLTPDFQGDTEALEVVLSARPEVFNHNVETVARLYKSWRPGGRYERSLGVLSYAANHPGLPLVKSGLMVGLGEDREEIEELLADLYGVGCRAVTIGQYIRPSARHHPVVRYYRPEEFEELAHMARAIGFPRVASGPFVRSSYRAEEAVSRRQCKMQN